MALQEKMKKKSSFFSFKKLLKLFFFLQLVIVCVDLYKHRGYKGSKTAKVIKEYGIDEAVEKSLTQGKIWVEKANSWAVENYPEYYDKTVEVMGPPCKFAGEKLAAAWKWFLEATKPARDYLNRKVPQILEKVEAELPGYIQIVKEYLSRFWEKVGPHIIHFKNVVCEFVKEYGPIALETIKEFFKMIAQKIYELAPDFFASATEWLKNASEQIQEKGPQILRMSKDYAITALHMTCDIITGIIEQIKKANSARQEAKEPSVKTPHEQTVSSSGTPETIHKSADTPSKTPPKQENKPSKNEL